MDVTHAALFPLSLAGAAGQGLVTNNIHVIASRNSRRRHTRH